MRILMELRANNDQTIDHMIYHKLQGFVYGTLISSTPFKNLHDSSSYKFFSYSNIFPPMPLVKSGDHRYLLLGSPNHEFIKSVSRTVKAIIECGKTVNIGDQTYTLVSARLIKHRINSTKCVIQTSTPIMGRIPEKSYSQFQIPVQYRKAKFLYWRRYLPADILIKLIEDNMRRKYESFYNIKIDYKINDTFHMIEEFTFIKEVIVHLPIGYSTLKVPTSFWKFHCDTSGPEQRRILHFILDR